ncbi:MAG TPA: acyl-CoA dehydratase activase [Armatimonadota bacterium]|jgi:predicted CoA-substrate-specific enzyme activase
MSERLYLGIDVGSISVNLAILDENSAVVEEHYLRHHGQPMHVAAEALRAARAQHGEDAFAGLAATGSGGRAVAQLLGGSFINEVVAQAAAVHALYPAANSIIEIGGEDSKLILLRDEQGNRSESVADFAMNAMCAAGTGCFLDQQANRLGLSIEEFGQAALHSEHPPRVAGRCSVFAKSDMIHLQQKATPEHDIIAGLCFALVRNFKSTVGSGATLLTPVSFQGGVAANPGIIRAMREVFELAADDLIIPEHFAAMGAIGAVLRARGEGLAAPQWARLDELDSYLAESTQQALAPLRLDRSVIMPAPVVEPQVAPGEKLPAYLGVDVGSISTNVVVIDGDGQVLAKEYLMTAGRPLEAVKEGLRRVGERLGDKVEIRGACTTGSGRYLTADFLGADVVKNEITAHARGALFVDPQVDTIFEIGGQDSKYVSLENGAVVDFEMNKVCAAGTGSFLEEQAERLGVSIKGEFAKLAFEAESPLNLGERCTVFMETELTRNQQAGAATTDLVAGLAYSIVYNYLNKVVGQKRVGEHILFQGGTALNHAVVAAFEHVTGKPIIVPPHNEVLGAVGCAIIAKEECGEAGSSFKGFGVVETSYEVRTFECQDCPNHCEINEVLIEGESPLFYGSRCEKYDVREKQEKAGEHLPDLFREREKLLLTSYTPTVALAEDAPRVGVPRALLFHELFPFWQAVLTEMGAQPVLSSRTNKRIIHSGAEASVSETCFPVKVALGHVLELLNQDLDFLLLPSIITMESQDESTTDSFVCPYNQSIPYTLAAAVDFELSDVKLLTPIMYFSLGRKHLIEALSEMGRELGAKPAQVTRAVDAGLAALAEFRRQMQERGREVLAGLQPEDTAIVVVSRSYNGCDPGANLQIPQKLRNMGVLPIPLDYLPLDDVKLPEGWFNMYWGYGQRILLAAHKIARDPRLNALYLTNFSCGPDSFLLKFFSEGLGDNPALIIEVDEHSADAGMITRCEAFLDSLAATRHRPQVPGRDFHALTLDTASGRTVLIPNMSGHAVGLAAAFRGCGVPAEVLPEPDAETLHWGRQYTSGKECFPCIVTTGDMVKYTKRPDFDRDKVAFFMGGSGGPCRFGQYNTLQRMVLDDLGYSDVPIYAPNQAASFYDDLGVVGQQLLRLSWQGLVAADLLDKAVLQTRPYELESGAADQVYAAALHEAAEAIARNDGSLPRALRQASGAFRQIPVDKSVRRPLIGMVGEFYVRANAFSNQDLIRKIEALGGEVWSAPVYEWFLYRNVRRSMRAAQVKNRKLLIKNWLTDKVMKHDEHKLAAAFDGFLENAHEPSTEKVLGYAKPYVHRTFEGEAIMTVGKAVDFAQKGLSGVVSVMPFTCMPGTISHALMRLVRRDHDHIPFLNMVYDGLEQATAETRLEAFMAQAREFGKTRKTPVA